jgi:hypothetical protein
MVIMEPPKLDQHRVDVCRRVIHCRDIIITDLSFSPTRVITDQDDRKLELCPFQVRHHAKARNQSRPSGDGAVRGSPGIIPGVLEI